jgi:hypothetical protein
MVLLHLFFCQQWWPPTPAHLQQWWLPIVNGWCRPFVAHAMATNPTITPFAIHVGQLSSCFFSTGLQPAALPSLPFRECLWPSLQVLAKPFNH